MHPDNDPTVPARARLYTMSTNTAALRVGHNVTVLADHGGGMLTVDFEGTHHTVMQGDLLDVHAYCEHEHGWCVA